MTPCPTCSCEYAPIPGSGPAPCRLLFLGERPGKREQERHRVFCGPTGQELDETYLLRQAGLLRDQVAVHNSVLCYADGNRTPSRKEVLGCASHHLPSLLKQVQPEIIVLMGGSAAFLLDEPKKLDLYHGRPVYGSILGGVWEGWIWLSYHPSLGMHKTSAMTQLLEDFKNLGLWLKGEWSPPVAPVVTTEYHWVRSVQDMSDYLFKATWEAPEIAMDTESHGRQRWSTQISCAPGTGVMWRPGDRAVDREFAEFVRTWQGTWIFHHAAHDLDELERDGIYIPRWRDTMQEAYHQCSVPQGLKPLAFQLLGVTMRSWEDVVFPASLDALCSWLSDAVSLADNLRGVTVERVKRGWCKECGHGAHTKKACGKKNLSGIECGCPANDHVNLIRKTYTPSGVSLVSTHLLKHVLGDPDYNESDGWAWGALERMKTEGIRGKKAEAWEWEYAEEMLGPAPILGIGNCTPEEALAYGVSDADHTLQVADALAARRAEGRFEINEGDMDV